jgi:hypothetical protein
MIEPYPLCWPDGYDRAVERYQSNFKMTANKARKHLLDEVYRLSGDDAPILSSNVPLRKKDGQMFADVANDELYDPGVAIYFKYNKQQVVFCCDEWLTPAENLRALGSSIEALRSLERWKCSGIMKRALKGFKALPPAQPGNQVQKTQVPVVGSEWWEILGVSKNTDRAVLDAAYKILVKKYHPDNQDTGNRSKFEQVQNAYEHAKKAIQ